MKALVVTASVVLLALMALFGLLAVLPGPQGGSPVVTIAVGPPPAETAPAPEPSVPQPQQQPPPAIDLPPGFGISPQPQKGKGAPKPGQQEAGAQPETQGNAQQTASVTTPTPMPIPPESETADVTLIRAPVEGLVEESRYGPLPKVAPDGRRALEVYARPSRYAEKAATGAPPRVALLIDGMGMADPATTAAVMKLPAPISVAYSAYGRDLQEWVDRARGEGHEVLLQIPLEPVDYPKVDPGPHTLLTTLPTDENMKRLQWLMSRFTGYVGVTNLMGGKFEPAQNAFVPVLEEVKARGLLFLDDGSVPQSAGGKIAPALGLDYAVANVQIDADVGKALAQLEAVAKERGAAIGVASAKPETIKQVAAWADQLKGKGYVLIPVSAAIRSQRQS
jgi:polysaccharide deacetylase 2 family uncharacterized protein YibQ